MKPFLMRETTSTRQSMHEEIATTPLGGNEWFLSAMTPSPGPCWLRRRLQAARFRLDHAGRVAVAQIAPTHAAQVAPLSPRSLASIYAAPPSTSRSRPPRPRRSRCRRPDCLVRTSRASHAAVAQMARVPQATLYDDFNGEGEHKFMVVCR